AVGQACKTHVRHVMEQVERTHRGADGQLGLPQGGCRLFTFAHLAPGPAVRSLGRIHHGGDRVHVPRAHAGHLADAPNCRIVGIGARCLSNLPFERHAPRVNGWCVGGCIQLRHSTAPYRPVAAYSSTAWASAASSSSVCRNRGTSLVLTKYCRCRSSTL